MTTPTPREVHRTEFDEQMATVRQDVVGLASLVLENGQRAVEAVLENTPARAAEVREADEEIDERYADLERWVFEILARQGPVAGDLRLLMSMTRILYEVERSGDLIVNCAKALERSHGFAMSPGLHALLAQLCREALTLFSEGIDVLAELDPDGGARLDERDDVVDELVGDFYTALIDEMGSLDFNDAIELSRVGRYMERIADHAVNVGEHVTYIVTGSFPDRES